MCTVGQRIKHLRQTAGIAQVDLASYIGVSKQTLYKYENDIITNIPSDKIELVAKRFDVSPAELMGWDNPSSNIHVSKSEYDLLIAYRSADVLTKQMVLRLLNLGHEEKENINTA